jgi:hypothetical protein
MATGCRRYRCHPGDRLPTDENQPDDLAHEESDEHEVFSRQAQEQRPDNQRHRRRYDESQDESQREGQREVRHAENRRIGAQAHEGGMRQRYVPGADDQVKTDRGDGRDHQGRAERHGELGRGEQWQAGEG